MDRALQEWYYLHIRLQEDFTHDLTRVEDLERDARRAVSRFIRKSAPWESAELFPEWTPDLLPIDPGLYAMPEAPSIDEYSPSSSDSEFQVVNACERGGGGVGGGGSVRAVNDVRIKEEAVGPRRYVTVNPYSPRSAALHSATSLHDDGAPSLVGVRGDETNTAKGEVTASNDDDGGDNAHTHTQEQRTRPQELKYALPTRTHASATNAAQRSEAASAVVRQQRSSRQHVHRVAHARAAEQQKKRAEREQRENALQVPTSTRKTTRSSSRGSSGSSVRCYTPNIAIENAVRDANRGERRSTPLPLVKAPREDKEEEKERPVVAEGEGLSNAVTPLSAFSVAPNLPVYTPTRTPTPISRQLVVAPSDKMSALLRNHKLQTLLTRGNQLRKQHVRKHYFRTWVLAAKKALVEKRRRVKVLRAWQTAVTAKVRADRSAEGELWAQEENRLRFKTVAALAHRDTHLMQRVFYVLKRVWVCKRRWQERWRFIKCVKLGDGGVKRGRGRGLLLQRPFSPASLFAVHGKHEMARAFHAFRVQTESFLRWIKWMGR
jgi:hypothetical protein